MDRVEEAWSGLGLTSGEGADEVPCVVVPVVAAPPPPPLSADEAAAAAAVTGMSPGPTVANTISKLLSFFVSSL